MKKVFVVRLTETERSELDALVRKGKASALTIARARILLKVDQGEDAEAQTDAQVAEALSVTAKTVFNVRRRWWKKDWRPRFAGRNRFVRLVHANSMAKPRRNSSPLVAAPFPKGGRGGRCGCLPANWSSWKSWTALARKRYAAR